MTRLPVCEAWFEAERLDDGLHLIHEPHTGALIHANAWLVLGTERDLLVDTGNGFAPLLPFVQNLRRDPEKPLLALATHAHMDHIGGLHEFDERLLHRHDVASAASPDRLLFSDEVWPGALGQMAEAGWPVAPLGIQAIPDSDFDPVEFVVPGSTPTRLVDEGDAVDLGDRRFQVLHLPGHTRGSIGLWDPSRGELFSGDAVYAGEPLIDTAPTSDVPSYLATIARLRDLPVEVVHGGHDASFGRDVLLARCDAYLARRS